MCIKSEFDENESNAAPPECPALSDKESQLDLPEDLNLDDADAGADDPENMTADDLEGDFLHFVQTVISKTVFYCIFVSMHLVDV